jgi:hypothetical protein
MSLVAMSLLLMTFVYADIPDPADHHVSTSAVIFVGVDTKD